MGKRNQEQIQLNQAIKYMFNLSVIM